jgi:ParB-like chromosome segregation protein Spo0J
MSKLDEQLIARMLDKLDKTHEVVICLDKKLDLHVLRTEQEFEAIRALDAHQNELLAEHSKRSDRLEADNKLREAALRKEVSEKVQAIDERISVLETPWKWVLTTKKGIIWLAALATAVAGIIEFIRRLGG